MYRPSAASGFRQPKAQIFLTDMHRRVTLQPAAAALVTGSEFRRRRRPLPQPAMPHMLALALALALVCWAVPAAAEEAAAVIQGAPWCITRDNGSGEVEEIFVPDLQAFLELAELTQLQELMDSEGLTVDDIKEVTNDDLVAMGVTKVMHRKRFLRYSNELHVSTAQTVEETEAEPWCITRDNGRAIEDLFVPDLQAFLELAELTQLQEQLDSEGLTVGDIKAVTNNQLVAMGVKKIMHRKRFLRYAEELHIHKLQTAEERAAEIVEQRKVAAFKTKKLYDNAKNSEHDFGFVCTESGEAAGACKRTA